LAEHRELKSLLGKIDQVLAERTGSVAEVSHLLAQLGDKLAKHFVTEEEGSYFSEALLHAPQLVSKANELLAQHPRMRASGQPHAIADQDEPRKRGLVAEEPGNSSWSSALNCSGTRIARTACSRKLTGRISVPTIDEPGDGKIRPIANLPIFSKILIIHDA